MFSSQDDDGPFSFVSTTPIFASSVKAPRKIHAEAREEPSSPQKKRTKGMFAMFGQGLPQSQLREIDEEENIRNTGIGLFGSSQDPSFFSQSSQEFADRISELTLVGVNEFSSSEQKNYSAYQNGNSSDGYSIPFNSQPSQLTQLAEDSVLDANWHLAMKERESPLQHNVSLEQNQQGKEIPLPITNDNPFITNEHGGIASQSRHYRRVSRPRTMWITAFGERPRLLFDFEIYETLGEGAFSSVMKVKRRLDGMYYAVKKIKKKIENYKEENLFLREVCALAALQTCPNIVRYFGSWIDDGHLHIQTEVCGLGNLESWFVNHSITKSSSGRRKAHSDSVTSISSAGKSNEPKSDDSYLYMTQPLSRSNSLSTPNNPTPDFDLNIVGQGATEELIWLILLKVSSALKYLHEKGIVHLDLRPANVFITSSDALGSSAYDNLQSVHNSSDDISNGLLNGVYTLRLGDFGHSCRVDEPDFIINEGETRYCALELIASSQTRQCDLKKADMFSLGASMYELCLGRRLGSEEEGLAEWHSIREGDILEVSLSIYSPGLVNTIKQLLKPNPAERLSASEVVQLCQNQSNHDPDPIRGKTPTSNSSPFTDPPQIVGAKNVSVFAYAPRATMPSPSSNTVVSLLDDVEKLKKQLKESQDQVKALKNKH